ncbi:unnamed protein product [Rotaria sp. Silwood2]|nr:unnamed protein product [Rotaria sp. Silwood2]CAF4248024.1 unnamed protein product [Rotaria sp. Silwood2]
MESLQEKSKLVDKHIQQLIYPIDNIEQLDSDVHINVLEEKNIQLKTGVQNPIDELVTLKNQQEITQHYDFVNKISIVSNQLTVQHEKSVEVSQSTASAIPKNLEKSVANTAMDITRFDLRIGKILSVKKHPNADSLYVEQIDVEEEKPQTVCNGLLKYMQPSDLDQKLVIVACNLKPVKTRGITSEAMLMCASTSEKIELLEPLSDCKPDDRIECDGYNCSSSHAQITKELSD